ncbi:hypothetical protein N657DRAFT_623449 [Parathielavia appendiculata]|uniref:Nucleoside phosphorylase domain-containing protein n=1 Tax=Parathielavia appendiculata TaxID=2587402 RepID=A0AAN6Z173_9PEZI|nr:hypothetical protein N657DRAFT_623449 [Parathielavia appendiculata]
MGCEAPTSREDFEIGIVCALPLEFDAAVAALDEVWGDDIRSVLGRAPGDRNTYPTMGKANAAIVASDLRHSYPGLCLALLVGICGGIPKADGREVLLGDVVISSSVVQYDFGRQYPDGFRRKDGPQNSLAAPLEENASILSILDTDYGRDSLREKMASFLKMVQQQRPKYLIPNPASDKLYQSTYRHKHQTSHNCECLHHDKESDPVCEEAMESSCQTLGCDDSYLVKRSRLEERLVAVATADADPDAAVLQPAIHVGKVATGDTVMKSGVGRDRIAHREGIIAFEMEAAGIWEQLPCLVVKGVCDYADSHKNKAWQDYAAATAAAAAKGIAMLHTPADKSRFRDNNPFRPESILPFTPDPEFVGRPAISAWLSEMSQRRGERVALVGLGGIGKSQLAIQFAHGVRNKSHVFWINATTWSTLETSCHTIADRLGLKSQSLPKSDSEDDIVGRVGDWLGREENGRWTVIIDNLDDASILPDDDPHLTKLLPQTSNGFVLVTSWSTAAAEQLTGSGPQNIYAVPPMGEEEALQLFRGKLRNGAACPEEDGREVVRLLDYMPLAISQAAAYINRRAPRVTVRDYNDMLRNHDKKGTLLGAEYQELRRYGVASNSILTTWMVTFDQLQRERPTAADLLSLMTFFSPQSIPEWVLKSLYDRNARKLPPSKVRDTVPPSMAALLSSFNSGRRYLNRNLDVDLNSRVWDEWIESDLGPAKGGEQQKADQAKQHASKGRWRARLSSKAKDLFSSSKKSIGGTTISEEHLPGRTPDAGDADDSDSGAGPDERLERDLETLLGYSLVTPSVIDGVLKMHPLVRYCTETWLARTGRLAKWKKRFLLIMAANAPNVSKQGDRWTPQADLTIHLEPLLRDEPPPDDGPTAMLWVILSIYLYYRWRDDKSEEAAANLLDKMTTVSNNVLGPGDRLTLACLNLRARRLSEQERYAEAEVVCLDILERAEKVGDVVCHIVMESQVHYASILRAQGRFDEAEEVTRAVVEQRIRLDGERGDETLWSMGNHVAAMVQVGKFREASDIAVKLLEEDWAGRDRHVYKGTITVVGQAVLEAAQTGKGDEVEAFVRRALRAAEKHPDTCRWFAYTVYGPFHLGLWVWLYRHDRDDEAWAAMDRGIEHMASVFALPRLHPPELPERLLAAKEDDKDTRQRLLRQIIGNLTLAVDDGRSREVFYWELANIARRLYMQGRYDEGSMLLEAMDRHFKEAYGEKHELTRSAAGLGRELERYRDRRSKEKSEDKGNSALSSSMPGS